MDIGADIGSTADFFLTKGAKLVVAVEGSGVFFQRLRANASVRKGIVPIWVFINSPDQVEQLILQRNYDVLKMDIEGGEINLFQINDAIFRRVPEYIIEVHSDGLFIMMGEKCAKNNYAMKVHNRERRVSGAEWRRMVYARRRDTELVKVNDLPSQKPEALLNSSKPMSI